MKIDSNTVVPLSWVIGGFVAGLTPLVMATSWIYTVNYRLERIEERLGIPQMTSKIDKVLDVKPGIEKLYANE